MTYDTKTVGLPEPVEREKALKLALSYLKDELEHNHKWVMELSERLQPLLDQKSTNDQNEPKMNETGVPYADELVNLIWQLQGQRMTLQDIAYRLGI